MWLTRKILHEIMSMSLSLSFRAALLASLVLACTLQPLRALDQRIQDTYTKLLPCIFNSPSLPAGLKAEDFHYPDDAEAHYQDLLNKTAKYRGHPTHYTKGFDGPWIENLWIENFLNKPLSYFSGLIPIFVQHVDIHVHSFMRMPTINNGWYRQLFASLAEDLKTLLRPNVLYIAVSQDDEGFSHNDLFKTRPNILVMSAGGYGHVPIPLVKGVMEFKALDLSVPGSVTYKTGFYGAPQNGDYRAKLLNAIEEEFKALGVPYVNAFGGGWEQKMSSTLFNLAPRGFGRTSYRLAEIVQVGRIPVFMYSDVPWTPYQGSSIGVESIGFITTGNVNVDADKTIKRTAQAIANMNTTGMQDYLNRVRQAREHYTLPGVIAQLDKFVKDPLGPQGGELKCIRVPEKAT
jgi:hypothetical protein